MNLLSVCRGGERGVIERERERVKDSSPEKRSNVSHNNPKEPYLTLAATIELTLATTVPLKTS